MKSNTVLGIFLILAGSFSFAEKKKINLPHILPDAPSSQYLNEYQKAGRPRAISDIDYAIKLGERNLRWLTHMNSFRPDGQKIQLTKVGDLKGIPVDSPKFYSPATVKADYDKIYQEMPAEMAKILYSSAPFTDNPPLPEADYVVWAKKVDSNYQTAVRWTLMEPYMGYLEARSEEDLRGFYHLSKKTSNVESLLRSYDSQTVAVQTDIRDWLKQMCQNNLGLNSGCVNIVTNSAKAGTLYELYLKHLPKSQALWNSQFSLENPRREITWSKNTPQVMNVPFRDPLNSTIRDFLKVNIEDEFKWDQWNMVINIVPQAPIHVVFKPGVTPNVNGPGGDTITMDANTPLTEWDVQWTIRHEFGHVLGFLDCYMEFYDPSIKMIVNYQLDVNHLMCSRAGRMQQDIYDTLKKFYFR